MRLKYKILFTIIVICLLTMPVMAKTNQNDTMMVPVSFAELAKQARPGVVNIQTEKVIKGGEEFTNIFWSAFWRKPKST